VVVLGNPHVLCKQVRRGGAGQNHACCASRCGVVVLGRAMRAVQAGAAWWCWAKPRAPQASSQAQGLP